MAQSSMFSGGTVSAGIGIPTGQGALMRDEDFRTAVENVVNDMPTTTTTLTRDWATFDEDGTILEQGATQALSWEQLGTGTYKVTSITSGSFLPQATVLSAEIEEPELTTSNRLWFTTTSPDNTDAHVLYDPVKDVVWGTDVDHVTSFVSGLPDRIAIGDMFAETPEVYLYLPSAFPILFAQQADTLFLDLEYRLAFIQASSTGGTRTTLIYDMDSYTLLQSSNAETGGTERVIIGHTSTHFLLRGDGNLFVWSRDANGLLDSLTDTEADVAIGFKYGIESSSGDLWYRDSSAPADWRQISLAGGSFSGNTRDGGTNSIADRIYDYNPTDNCIYYLNNNVADLHLMKILCESPFTVTELNGTAYPNDLGDPTVTLLDAVALRFTPDYSQIVVIRGQGSAVPWFYLVDPADGSIDTEFALPNDLGVNYGVETIVSLAGQVVSIGSNNLQLINYTVGDGGSSVTQEPRTIHTRKLSDTEALVETFISHNPGRVKIDSGFHIEFVRD